VALVGSALLLVSLGLGGGIAYGVVTGDAGKIPLMVGAALGQWPAVATFAGFAVAVFGLLPRLMGLAWAAFGLAAVLGQIGPLLRTPQWLLDLSPFTHAPKLPGSTVAGLPLVILTAVAVLLTMVGVAGFRRRDIG
jgi:ABC-2 type transport system permease protein